MRLNKLGIVLAAGMVITMLSALAATAAQAEENKGPLWIVGTRGLAAGQTRATVSRTEEEPILHVTATGAPNIVCEKATNTGFLLGGSPGTDFSKITFVKCHAENKPNCIATGIGIANAGEIIVNTLTILAYAKGSRTSAVDLFAPEEASNVFVEFELLNKEATTECALLNKQKVKVKAKGTGPGGTEVEIKSEKRKLGQVSQVGYLKAGAFFLSLAGEESEVGLLVLPSTPITEAELYNTATAKYEVVTAELEAGALGNAWEIAKAEIETTTKEPFGWNT